MREAKDEQQQILHPFRLRGRECVRNRLQEVEELLRGLNIEEVTRAIHPQPNVK